MTLDERPDEALERPLVSDSDDDTYLDASASSTDVEDGRGERRVDDLYVDDAELLRNDA